MEKTDKNKIRQQLENTTTNATQIQKEDKEEQVEQESNVEKP